MKRFVVLLSIFSFALLLVGQGSQSYNGFGNFSELIAQNKASSKDKAKAAAQKAKEKEKAQKAKEKEKAAAQKAKEKEAAAKAKEKEKAAAQKAKEKEAAAKAKEKEKEATAKAKEKEKEATAKAKEKEKEATAKTKEKEAVTEKKEKSSASASKGANEKDSKKTAQAGKSEKEKEAAQKQKDKATTAKAKEKEVAAKQKEREANAKAREKAVAQKEKEKSSTQKAKEKSAAQKEKEKNAKQKEKEKQVATREKANTKEKERQAASAAKKKTPAQKSVGGDDVGAHPFKPQEKSSKEISHNSLMLDGGMSVAFTDYATNGFGDKLGFQLGFTYMYHFTPSWGLGLNYNFNKLNVTPSRYTLVDNANLYELANTEVYNKHVSHGVHDISVQLSYNLTNNWFPRRENNLFNLYLLFGVGAGIYKKDSVYIFFERHNRGVPNYATSDEQGRGYGDPAGVSLLLNPGLHFDFNIARSVAFGVKVMANIYPQDNIEYWKSGTEPDVLLNTSLSLRVKLNAEKKTHICNISSLDSDLASSRKGSRSSGGAAIDADTLRKIINAVKRKKDTVVIYHIDTIYSQSVVQQFSTEHHQQDSTPLIEVYKGNVFFVPNSAALTDYSSNIIKEIVQRLDEDQSIIVEIMGYNDATGTEAANKKIALKRANVVADQLVNVYKIPRSRIKYIGVGKVMNSTAIQNTGVSRRAQVVLLKP